jgi:Mrp family chromosome partitioning ATPase
VLIDSPAVTAAADARIIAASSDATMMIVRPGASTRRQVEETRDGLRGVGARVIGVAINAPVSGGRNIPNRAAGQYPRATSAMSSGMRSATRRAERKLDPSPRPTSRT